MTFLKSNKPFLFFGSLIGLFGSFIGISLYLRDILSSNWDIALILLSVSWSLLLMVSTLIIARRFWDVIFVQKKPEIKYLKKQVNYLFALATIVFASAALDFIAGSMYVYTSSTNNNLNSLSIIIMIISTTLLIIVKLYVIKVSYRNLKINFKRGN